MSFTIGSLATGVKALLNGRTQYNNTMAEYAIRTALELQENYKFAELQTSGPVVAFTPLVANYDANFFLSVDDQDLTVNNIDSFFIYNNPFQPLSNPNDQNSGYNLVFSTINNIEVLINIPAIPVKWTRYNNQIWVGSVPDQGYNVYARYRHENPFPNRTNPTLVLNDLIMMPNTWQDVMEYATAQRIARDLNLAAKANELYAALYGDKQFQVSGGIEGAPGLIFMRTSQENRDQSTTTKSMRIRMGRQ